MNKLILFLLFIAAPMSVDGQATFLETGELIYERKINAYSLLEKEYADQASFISEYKARFGKFDSSYFYLKFNGAVALYEPGSQQNSSFFSFLEKVGYNNVVFTDLTNDSAIVVRNIFEKKVTLSDRRPRITWKLTDEERDIAGFHCRRANGLLEDSIFVVAFYAEQIPISAGPETFSGLPGLIMGVVVPRFHTTWFVKSIKSSQLSAGIQAPIYMKSADKVTYQSLNKEISSVLKDYQNSWSYERIIFNVFL